MITYFEKLKCNLIALSVEKKIEHSLNVESDVVENYEGYITAFVRAIELLEITMQKKDQIAIRCALTRVRIASLNMSNIYQDIIDDVVLINQQDSWPEIPIGYELPKHYHYPDENE